MPENILLLTCSAGHGHTIAITSIKKDLLHQNAEHNIIVFDVSSYASPLGPAMNTFWNFNMRRATHAMDFLPSLLERTNYEGFYEKFLHFPLSKKLKKIIEHENISVIYDAQPLYTNLFVNLLAGSRKNDNLEYHKVLTDLPTSRAQHFLPGIKRIQHPDNVNFNLHSKPPLLAKNESEADFWKKQCNLQAEQINDTYALPVYREYLAIPENLHKIEIVVSPALADYYSLDYRTGMLDISPQACVTTLMLGSQGLTVIPEYVDTYIEQAKKQASDKEHIFFVACSKNPSLFKKLEQKIAQSNLREKLPQHKIIPLAMQDPCSIAFLMWRSQHIIMRPSGLSCLEQLAMQEARVKAGVAQTPSIAIHIPYKKRLDRFASPQAQNDFLIEQSFGYERGNAEYLLAHLDADLITPGCVTFFD